MLQIESIREALKVAADKVRALPDEELVALALRNAGSTAGTTPRPTEGLRRELANRRPAKVRRRVVPAATRKASAPRKGGVAEAVLGALSATPQTTTEIGQAAGLDPKSVGDALRRLVAAGRARLCSGGGKGNPGTYAMAGRGAGRQARARRAQRPAQGADEEEGAPVLSDTKLPSPPPVPADLAPPVPDLSGLVHDNVAFRDEAVAIVATRGPMRWGDLLAGLPPRLAGRVGHTHLVAMLRSKRLFAVGGVGMDTLVTTTPPAASAASLPSFEIGCGPKHEDCRHYGACLTRWAKNPPRWKDLPDRGRKLRRQNESPDGEVSAQCPEACSFFEPTPRHVHLQLAMVGGRHPNAGEA